MSNYLDAPVVIFDNGSGICKAGLSGENVPRSVISSMIGRVKTECSMVEANRKAYYVGEEAQSLRGILALTYPIEHGIVKSWPDMERIWKHVYDCELQIQSNESPVLLSEAPFNPRSNREIMAEVMFESFNVPAMYVALQATLSLYASGRTTGLVVDIGDGVTSTFPIFEGTPLPHAGNRLNFAGRDITDHLMRLLMETGHSFVSSAEKDIAREIKEKICYVALDPKEEAENCSAEGLEEYILPDGNVVTIGRQRFLAPESLFSPSVIGMDTLGVHKMILESIYGCAIDVRRSLFNSILLSGASTLFPGLEDRLYNEIRTLAPETVEVEVIAPSDRKFSVWIGGSVLTSLESFKEMWITSKDYSEFGSAIIHRTA
ncbi:actin, cytoplasmic-like [Phyllobates terribilis]|uniref:actin, cytoplasmic-like n=1 Tax=Phyllobates terribilis TaxID=111132 RepID=UPI003CCA9324